MASVELAHADNLRTADNRMAASLGTVRAVFTVVQIIMRLVEMIILAKRNNGYYNTTQKKH